jgi:hypothetical protein
VADYYQIVTERESITFEERYFGAKITSVVLKAFGILWLIAGAIVIYRTDVTRGTHQKSRGATFCSD